MIKKCLNCHKDFKYHPQNRKYFCGKKCFKESLKGKLPSNWKYFNRTGKDGYKKGEIVWKKCLICQKPIRKWRKYCSQKCFIKINNAGILHGFKKGHKSWNEGKKMSVEFREKMSKASLGRLSKRKGKHFPEFSGKSHPMWKGGLPKCKECGKEIYYGKIRCLKCHLGTKRMTTLEIRVQKVINKYNLPYKFVGNGKFYIEKKNPDFININGEKKAIEVYWKKHKDRFRKGGEKGWRETRSEIFKNYGWNLLFLEGTGLNENKILQILKGGY